MKKSNFTLQGHCPYLEASAYLGRSQTLKNICMTGERSLHRARHPHWQGKVNLGRKHRQSPFSHFHFFIFNFHLITRTKCGTNKNLKDAQFLTITVHTLYDGKGSLMPEQEPFGKGSTRYCQVDLNWGE